MDISKLLIKAYKLLDSAQVDDGTGFENNAIKHLVSLRELLDRQPELKYFVKCESDKPSNGS